jgi:hypothetical protein
MTKSKNLNQKRFLKTNDNPDIKPTNRGTFADILKALSFHLGMPKFDWKKVIGSTKLGASFGLRMENFVDLNLGTYFLCMCFTIKTDIGNADFMHSILKQYIE